jgi:hypothetical protein
MLHQSPCGGIVSLIGRLAGEARETMPEPRLESWQRVVLVWTEFDHVWSGLFPSTVELFTKCLDRR